MVSRKDDPNTEWVPVARDGYPVLVFVEFGRDGSWSATEVSRVDPDPLGRLDSRGRGVLRAYASDLIRRLSQFDLIDASTLHLPTGTFRLTDDD